MKISVTPLFIILLLVFSGVHSQGPAPSWKAQLLTGPAFPVGHFASASLDSGAYNAARPGPAISFSISYRFKHSPFGVEIIGGWQQNNVDDSAVARSISKSVPVGAWVKATSDNWHIWKVLIGPSMEIPIKTNGKIDFECALLAGILKTAIPGLKVGIFYPREYDPMTYNLINYSLLIYSNAPFTVPVAFCYQANAGINYRITHHTSLACDLNFMHAAPVHSFTYYQDPPYYTKPVHVNQSYPISTLNLMLGVSYAF